MDCPATGTARAAAPIVRQAGTTAASVEVQILQTAASLENVVVATYASALELPFVRNHAPLRQFVETTMQHHVEHGEAFNTRAEARGGESVRRRPTRPMPTSSNERPRCAT